MHDMNSRFGLISYPDTEKEREVLNNLVKEGKAVRKLGGYIATDASTQKYGEDWNKYLLTRILTEPNLTMHQVDKEEWEHYQKVSKELKED